MEWAITVWDEPKLLYVSVAKGANTAVKAALLESYFGNRRWGNPHAPDLPYVEATRDEVRSRYKEYVSFTVVRDPFDRFVSFWADKIAGTGWYPKLGKHGFRPGMGFEEAALVAARLPDKKTDPHIESQVVRLRGPGGDLLVDLVLRFEHLADDWEDLRQIAGARAQRPLKPIKTRRKSDHGPWRRYYTPAAEQAIAERFRDDFATLGYRPKLKVTGDEQTPTLLHELHAAAADGAVVIDTAGEDPVRRAVVRSAGGIYLPTSDPIDSSSRVVSARELVQRLGAEQQVIVLVTSNTPDSDGFAGATVIGLDAPASYRATVPPR